MNYHSAPVNRATIPIDVGKLSFIGGVLFGSRALGVDHYDSDYDYCVLHSNLDALLETSKVGLHIVPLEEHFDCMPPYGLNYLIKALKFNNDSVDLLVLEHQEHVNMMHKATSEVASRATKLLLKDKDIRKSLYKDALLNNGFVRNTWWRRLLLKS